MFNHLRQRARNEEGFTLIELLVVILIIGILAAIAIPNFLGQSKKANDASSKSDVRNAVSAMESCFTDAQTYAGCTLTGSGITSTTTTAQAQGAVAISGTPNATGYTLVGYSRSGNSFTITNANGTYTYSCTGFGTGGCPASPGNWG